MSKTTKMDGEKIKQYALSMMLDGFQVLEYSIIPIQFSKEPDFNFKHNINYRVLVNKLEIALILTTELCDDNGDPGKVLSKIVTSTTFDVPNLKDYIKGDEIQLPTVFLQLMSEIATSTTRGALHMLHKGTPLHTALIPLASVGFPATDMIAFTQQAEFHNGVEVSP